MTPDPDATPPPAAPRSGNRVARVFLVPFRPVLALFGVWRRSLQLRAVVTTIVLATVVVALVGTLLQRQLVNSILDTKTRSSVAEASRGFAEAQRTLESGAAGDEVATDIKLQFFTFVERYGTSSGGSSSKIVIRGGSPTAFTVVSRTVDGSSIPDELEDAVQTTGVAQRTYGQISYTEPVATAPAILVGQQVRDRAGTPYDVYFLFPLTQEQELVEVVQRLLLAGSGLLLVLIGVVAWLVARRTLSPVRHAARIAERLAAGGLQERIHVRGVDDLARLATSFNRMASSLQRQINQLEELSRMQQRFVSDVSHELRTPLTTVRMAADVLHDARPQLDPAAARSAELLQNELDRFEHLLAELLEISRFDAGAAELEPETIDCRDLARQVAAAATPLAERTGSELALDLPDEPCYAEVDPRRITRILRNLLENAIEHGEGRAVVIMVGADDRAVAFLVRDHGIGLQPGEAASVFNRFWRADPSRRRTLGGTGLGLAIALEDTHLHDGWLQAWGRPGIGSQFRLTVPRRRGWTVDSSPLPMGMRVALLPVAADRTPVGPADSAPQVEVGSRSG